MGLQAARWLLAERRWRAARPGQAGIPAWLTDLDTDTCSTHAQLGRAADDGAFDSAKAKLKID